MTADLKQLLETMPEAPEAWADAQIGRYVFRRLVGTGGMGIVVAAHDPELDREVAIKIVVTGETDDVRPIREAQAMARLSHPNVVRVYEVIRLGTRTAIVMELVEGEELGAWQRASRSWREIVDAYVQASRGLAAAHRAGIVHRDFKPSNALIDRDGVVRVTDFGLAQPTNERGTDTGSKPVGTPAYMAPEQHRKETVDARTDQWGLACSLYEALYGRRPFASAEASRLPEAVTRGELDAEPADSPVPRRIRAAIRRALATDPALRFATVDDFAAALGVRPRGRYYVLAAAAAISIAAIVVLATRDSTGPSCEGLDAPIRAVWSDAVRADIRARLLAPSTGLPAATVDKALARLDAYAAAWTATRTQACTDSQQGVRSTETLDTRMRCLDRRLAEVSGLLDGLTTGDAATLRATGDAVAQLQPPATCSEAKDIARPQSATARAELDMAEQGMARASALVSLGQFERALPLLERAVTAGEQANAPAVIARALVLRGECEDRLARHADALATLQRAAKLAARAQDHAVVADALCHAFLVEGDHLGHRSDALRSRPYIELAIEAAGQPDAIRAEWLHYLAIMLYDDASFIDEAATHEREALAIRRKTLPAGHLYIVDSMETLANIEATRRNFDESTRLLTQVLEARIAARGPRDAMVGAAYSNLGVNENYQNNMLGALDYFERAVEIAKATGHPNIAAQFNLANTQLDVEHWRDAATSFEAALELSERVAGKDSRDVADSALFLGVARIATGDYERGRPMLLRGLEISRRSGSPLLATALAHAARLALHDGNRKQAHALMAESLALSTTDPIVRDVIAAEIRVADVGCAAAKPALAKALDEAVGNEQGMLIAQARVALAECEISIGDTRAAKERLETELARLLKDKADDTAIARVRKALASIRVQ